MDRDRLDTWGQIRTTLAGPHRQLAIPAVIAATLFCNVTKKPDKGSDARKVSGGCERTDCERAGEDAAG
jgi:hypothetical protein